MKSSSIAIIVAALVAGDPAPQPAPASASFPVSMRVDAASPRGPLKPIWRFFGADEPNYAYMSHGQETGRASWAACRRAGLLPRAQPAHDRRWHAGAEVGLDERLHARTRRAVRSTTGPSSIASSTPTCSTASSRTCRSASCRRPSPSSRNPISTRGRPTAKYDEIYTGWAYPPRDYQKWGDLAYEWAKHCVEKYGRAEVEQWVLADVERGEHRVLARHARGVSQAARLRRSMACVARCRRPGSAAPTRPATAGSGCATSSSTSCGGGTARRAQVGTPHRFRLVPREGPTGVRRRPRAHGDCRRSSRPSTRASGSSPRSPSSSQSRS